jgi:hypothetical protein
MATYNTSGLSGYAKAYAEERNRGKNDIAAHAAATQAYGSGGSGAGRTFSVFNPNVPGGSPGDILTYELEEPKPMVKKEKEFDPTAYIEQLKTAKRQSLLAALDKARTTALTGLETEKANVAPTY